MGLQYEQPQPVGQSLISFEKPSGDFFPAMQLRLATITDHRMRIGRVERIPSEVYKRLTTLFYGY